MSVLSLGSRSEHACARGQRRKANISPSEQADYFVQCSLLWPANVSTCFTCSVPFRRDFSRDALHFPLKKFYNLYLKVARVHEIHKSAAQVVKSPLSLDSDSRHTRPRSRKRGWLMARCTPTTVISKAKHHQRAIVDFRETFIGRALTNCLHTIN